MNTRLYDSAKAGDAVALAALYTEAKRTDDHALIIWCERQGRQMHASLIRDMKTLDAAGLHIGWKDADPKDIARKIIDALPQTYRDGMTGYDTVTLLIEATSCALAEQHNNLLRKVAGFAPKDTKR